MGLEAAFVNFASMIAFGVLDAALEFKEGTFEMKGGEEANTSLCTGDMDKTQVAPFGISRNRAKPPEILIIFKLSRKLDDLALEGAIGQDMDAG